MNLLYTKASASTNDLITHESENLMSQIKINESQLLQQEKAIDNEIQNLQMGTAPKDYYQNSYSNFPILCIHPTSDVYLEGTDSTSYRKTIYVTVKKCKNSTELLCKSDQEIVKFVNRLHVNVYSIT